MWVEKNGMFGNSERRTQQWFKMVNPPGEARDDCWQTIAVARKLFDLGHPGMKDKDGKFLFHIDRRRRARKSRSGSGRTTTKVNVDEKLFDEYREFTLIKHKDLAPYPELVKARGLRWPVVKQPDGTLARDALPLPRGVRPVRREGQGRPVLPLGREGRQGAHLVPPLRAAARSARQGVSVLALHRPRARALAHRHDDQAHPAAAAGHAGRLRRDQPRRRGALGIKNGDKVRLETRRGSLELPAWIDGRGQCPKGHVFVPFFDETKLINRLTLDAHCPFSKQPDYKKCAVRIVKVSA